METLEELRKCERCGKSGDDLSLYSVNHKYLGWIKVCRDCWIKSYQENSVVAGSGSCSSGCSCNRC